VSKKKAHIELGRAKEVENKRRHGDRKRREQERKGFIAAKRGEKQQQNRHVAFSVM